MTFPVSWHFSFPPPGYSFISVRILRSPFWVHLRCLSIKGYLTHKDHKNLSLYAGLPEAVFRLAFQKERPFGKSLGNLSAWQSLSKTFLTKSEIFFIWLKLPKQLPQNRYPADRPHKKAHQPKDQIQIKKKNKTWQLLNAFNLSAYSHNICWQITAPTKRGRPLSDRNLVYRWRSSNLHLRQSPRLLPRGHSSEKDLNILVTQLDQT